MKPTILHIQIKKNEQEHSFWHEKQEISMEEILSMVKETKKHMLYFETVENEQVLLSGYFVYTNDTHFKRQLKRAAKAQVTF